MTEIATTLVTLTNHLSGVLTVRTLARVATTLDRPTLQEELDDLEAIVADELSGLPVPEAALDVLRCAETLLDEHVPPAPERPDTIAEAVVGLFDGLCHLRAAHGYDADPLDEVTTRTTEALAAALEELGPLWPAEVLAAVTGLLAALDERLVARLERLA